MIKPMYISGLLLAAAFTAAQGQTLSSTTPPATTSQAPAATAAQAEPEGGTPTYVIPESPERRMARLGTTEDPGPTPDPKIVFYRFGKQYTIQKYDRFVANYGNGDRPGWVRPIGFVNSYREIYQQNNDWVWVWEEVPGTEPPVVEEAAAAENDLKKSTRTGRLFTDQQVEFFEKIRSEFAPLTPPASTRTIGFEESSKGLPVNGSFRNSLDVADMNGDGFPDLIVPPERGGAGSTVPTIYLGDGKGNWQFWKESKWPQQYDYGSVVAADFNRDGKMDVALGVHLRGVYVALGDGKGNFIAADEGLPHDFATRRIRIADVDRDGTPDIVVISEGPTAVRATKDVGPKLRVYLTRKNGTSWVRKDVSTGKERAGGDWLAIGDFNADKYADFAAASVYYGSTGTLFVSDRGANWKPVDSDRWMFVPTQSIYTANVAGKFASHKTDDVVVSYSRFWPDDLNPKLIPTPPITTATGIDRLDFSGKKPQRKPIMRWSGSVAITALGAGDFDGDRNLDLLVINPTTSVPVLLLGDGKGGFTAGSMTGMPIPKQNTYDIKVADVNGDGRPDVILMFETDETGSFAANNGSVRVYLNRGSAKASAAK